MRHRSLALGTVGALALVGVLLTGAATATADAVYPSAHIPLHPLGNVPLRSGFVENIHPNGPNVFAHEVYVVNGALPNTSFQVTIAVHVRAPTCSGAPVSITTATLETNAAGNGRADVVFTRVDAAGLRNASHGAIWTLSSGGVGMYQTACSVIVLD